MVRTSAVLLFAVVVASSVVAQQTDVVAPGPVYHYIIPVTGNLESAGGIFYSYTRIINISPSDAIMSFALFPADHNARCLDTPLSLAAGGFATLAQRCEGAYGVEIVSTQPLYVRSEVLAYTRERFREGPDEEPIPISSSYIPAGQTALVPDVGGSRSNLVIVNPNNLPLTVTVSGLAATDQSTTVVLPSSSIRLLPVTQFAASSDPVTGARHFKVTADGQFLAGASSARDNGSAQYRAGVALGSAPPAQ